MIKINELYEVPEVGSLAVFQRELYKVLDMDMVNYSYSLKHIRHGYKFKFKYHVVVDGSFFLYYTTELGRVVTASPNDYPQEDPNSMRYLWDY